MQVFDHIYTHSQAIRIMDFVAVVNVGTAIMYIKPKKERRVCLDISSRINKDTHTHAHILH